MAHVHTNPAITLSVRVAPAIRDQLDDLADATGRTKSFLAAEAIEYYLSIQAWQVKEIKQSLNKADSKKAKFIDHEDVANWLNSWGSKKEKGSPK